MKSIQNTKVKYRYFLLPGVHLLYRTEGSLRCNCSEDSCSRPLYYSTCHQGHQQWRAECTHWPSEREGWFKGRNGCFRAEDEISYNPFEVKNETH